MAPGMYRYLLHATVRSRADFSASEPNVGRAEFRVVTKKIRHCRIFQCRRALYGNARRSAHALMVSGWGSAEFPPPTIHAVDMSKSLLKKSLAYVKAGRSDPPRKTSILSEKIGQVGNEKKRARTFKPSNVTSREGNYHFVCHNINLSMLRISLGLFY